MTRRAPIGLFRVVTNEQGGSIMGQASAGPGVNAVTANGIDSLASDAAANGVEHTDLKNRWLIAASAVGIHISIGSVYAWSVFNLPLENAFGWAKSDVYALDE